MTKSTPFVTDRPTRLKPSEKTLQTIMAFAAAYHAESDLLQFILN
jgi:hypothetical protein